MAAWPYYITSNNVKKEQEILLFTLTIIRNPMLIFATTVNSLDLVPTAHLSADHIGQLAEQVHGAEISQADEDPEETEILACLICTRMHASCVARNRFPHAW